MVGTQSGRIKVGVVLGAFVAAALLVVAIVWASRDSGGRHALVGTTDSTSDSTIATIPITADSTSTTVGAPHSDDVITDVTAEGVFLNARTNADGTAIELTIVGGPPYDANDQCSMDYVATAAQAADAVRVTLQSASPRADGAGDFVCDALGHSRKVTVALDAPLAGRDLYVIGVQRPVVDFSAGTDRWLGLTVVTQPTIDVAGITILPAPAGSAAPPTDAEALAVAEKTEFADTSPALRAFYGLYQSDQGTPPTTTARLVIIGSGFLCAGSGGPAPGPNDTAPPPSFGLSNCGEVTVLDLQTGGGGGGFMYGMHPPNALLLRGPAQTPSFDALVGGELQIGSDRCVRLAGHTIVWPAGTTQNSDGSIVLPDHRTLRQGQKMAVTGSEMAVNQARASISTPALNKTSLDCVQSSTVNDTVWLTATTPDAITTS